jgi:hypothetical protein
MKDGLLRSRATDGSGLIGVGGAEVGEAGDRAQGHEVLDGLVGWSVFADGDGVVGKDEERVDLHERGQADGRLGVVGKDEKC